MLRLRCIRENNCRGFALSFDAALAVVLFVGALAFMQLAPYPAPDPGTSLAQTRQLAGDAIAALENTGFIAGKFDELGFSQDAADAIYAEFRGIAPELDANIAIMEYDYNLAACLETGKFGDCFPESDVFTVSAGNAAPAGSSLTRGSSVFVRKQGPSVCTKELLLAGGKPPFPRLFSAEKRLLLKGKQKLGETAGRLFFAEPPFGELFFQGGGGDGNVSLDFNVSVTPSDEAECGENIDVTLHLRAIIAGRKPVNIIPVIDRSGSMDECAIVDGNVTQKLSGSIGGGVWSRIANINVANREAFDVLMQWTADCGFLNCPDTYVRSPSGINYGYYGGEPANGCYVRSEQNNKLIYILIPKESSENGTWGVYARKYNPAIDYNLTVKIVERKVKKLEAVKDATIEFIEYPDWNATTNGDKLGLASFSTKAKLDQQLLLATDQNKAIIVSKVEALEAGGATATGEGIYIATAELISPRATPDANKFQIVLSDGKTNQGRDAVGAAADAYSKGIIVYTIGFGADVDKTELQQIAQAGGGKYYSALDVNRLDEIYELIAMDIGEARGGVAASAEVHIPIPAGMDIVDSGGGVIDGNYLIFNAADLNGESEWTANYTINYPCTENCDINSVTIPSEGAYVTYDSQQVAWDSNVTIIFKYRDLNVMILSGRVVGENDVYLDVRAANIGYLDSGATSIDFYLGDPDSGGELIGSMPVSALCPMNEPGCVNYYVLELRRLLREGELYSVINRSGAISECPGNNKDWILCTGAPKTKYYSLQYTVWRRYE